ncbi:MAG: nucleoside hydrolase [Pseudomonadota bacterium]
MTRPTPMVIDTDPGCDDALAILGALADPTIDLVGLSAVYGNVPVETASRNARQLVDLAGADVPVAEGAGNPLVQPRHPPADFVHGTGGFGEAALPAPARPLDPRPAHRFLAETAAQHRGALVLVAIGPMTNLALALQHHPQIAHDVARVVLMGGTWRHRGNVSDAAEANFWNDPHAAAAVLAAPWDVTMVGLDVTETVRLYPDDLDPMPTASPRAGAFLRHALAFYDAFHTRTRGFTGCFLHDPVAMMAAEDPALLETRPVPLSVAPDGAAAGGCVPAPGAKPTLVAVSANGPALRRRLIDTLCSGRLP